MELTITNSEGLDRWVNERMTMGRNITAIKGMAPEGATYSDGDPITTPVNIAWQDTTTGEIYGIEYADPNVEFRRGEAIACNAGLGAERPRKD